MKISTKIMELWWHWKNYSELDDPASLSSLRLLLEKEVTQTDKSARKKRTETLPFSGKLKICQARR